MAFILYLAFRHFFVQNHRNLSFTEQEIAAFRELYKKHFGKEISLEEATKKATRLVLFVKAVKESKKLQMEESAILDVN